MRSTPTTCRTRGATTSAACAAPQQTSSTSRSSSSGSSCSTVPAGRRRNGESGPENRPTWRLKEARTTSSWSVMQPLLQSGAVGVAASTARERGRTGRDARRIAGAGGRVARGRRRPRRAVAHPRPAPAAVRVRRRRRGRDRRLAPSAPAATGSVDPGRPRPPDHAAQGADGGGVLPSVAGARPRRPGAGAVGGRAGARDDRVRRAVAHRPARERSHRRRVLHCARAADRGVARHRRSSAAAPDAARSRSSPRSCDTHRSTSPTSTSSRCAPRSASPSGRCDAPSAPRRGSAGASTAPRVACCGR